ASLTTIAEAILGSEEFNAEVSARYGVGNVMDLSNETFLEFLYDRVLGRAPDAEGFAFWRDLLEAGSLSRAEVLVLFTESSEARERFADQTQALWAVDLEALIVRSFYEVAFGRDPDAEGFQFWKNALESGLSLRAMADFFVASEEFQAILAGREIEEVVELLYTQGLGRAPDAEGLAFWTGLIEDGTGSWSDVLLGFILSDEQNGQFSAYRDGIGLFGIG
ncbi:MAG: DUF4214 domain-containing protein, partial [Rhodovarius sp.]|nr:DUF4214 domain-containing protein [Rhodovarius sp.]